MIYTRSSHDVAATACQVACQVAATTCGVRSRHKFPVIVIITYRLQWKLRAASHPCSHLSPSHASRSSNCVVLSHQSVFLTFLPPSPTTCRPVNPCVLSPCLFHTSVQSSHVCLTLHMSLSHIYAGLPLLAQRAPAAPVHRRVLPVPGSP
jgi:hypothetical protein